MNILLLLTLTLTPLLTKATNHPQPSTSTSPSPAISMTCLNPNENIPKFPHIYGNTGVTIYKALPEMVLAVTGTYEANERKSDCWDTPNPLYCVIFSVRNKGLVVGGDAVVNQKALSELMFGLILEKCRDFGGVADVRDGRRDDWEFGIKAEAGRCANIGVKS